MSISSEYISSHFIYARDGAQVASGGAAEQVPGLDHHCLGDIGPFVEVDMMELEAVTSRNASADKKPLASDMPQTNAGTTGLTDWLRLL